MNKLFLSLLIVALFGCKPEVDRKLVALDSLKHQYAGKEIHLTFTNNEAGTESLLAQYAYVDRKKSEPAFQLNREEIYKLAMEEDVPYVPTSDQPQPENIEMVLIEVANSGKRGFVSYKLIKQFRDVSLYDQR